MNAGVADSPPQLTKRAIRGQLVQGYRTKAFTKEEVDKFEEDFEASGEATIRFETAGSRICIDAKITGNGFEAKVAHFHMGDFGSNGVQMADLSKKRIVGAPGRFLGCGTLADFGVDASQQATLAAKFLASPEHFYIQFHGDKPGTDEIGRAHV